MSRRVEVEIELLSADWDALRHEGRDLIGALDRSQMDYEYTYFNASVVLDGVRYRNVGLRKKGYWGSLSVVRPSLKIDFDRYVPNETHLGFKKLTLNNGKDDPSRTHECMAYDLFARAGVPAPRCNLAHVVVNGQDLGIYSNIESVDKRMLARHFNDTEGNLYEGQVSDFTRADVDSIELKTNEEANDISGLLALVTALEADEDVVLEQLGSIVDIERFRDFWAMELLTGHWDGYANNANNYLAYHDPGSGLFRFLPWGTDNTFEKGSPRGRIYAWGLVARRLYNLPDQRERFWTRVAELTDSVWDVPALLEHIDQVAALAPEVAMDHLDRERQHVATRAELLRATFGGAYPQPRRRNMTPCEGTLGDIAGTFSTTFRELTTSPLGSGDFTAALTLDNEPIMDVSWSGEAGLDSALPDAVPMIRYRGTLADAREVFLDLYIEPTTFKPGIRRFHGVETYGIVNVSRAGSSRYVARIGNGELTLIEAELTPGALVRGSFSARLYQVGCAWR